MELTPTLITRVFNLFFLGGEGEVNFYGKGGARCEEVLELPSISRGEGGLTDIKNGG